jgi:nitroreductase
VSKEADLEYPVINPVADRWSPYGFSEEPVSTDDLRSLLEAARWAPSSYNEQPWRYIVATRSNTQQYDAVLSCLAEPNQQWAKAAAVLMLGVISRQFEKNGKPNKAAEHDLGLASANLSAEATQRGLFVHQMIGIDPEKAREVFAIPEGYEALTGLAVGHRADPDTLPDALRERDEAPRQRKAQSEFVFGGKFGEAL